MTSTVAHADPAEVAQERQSWWSRERWTSDRLARLIELLAVLPALATVVEIARAPRLHFLDYWDVLLRISNPDGSFHPAGLLKLKNEQPVTLPSLMYWMDARLFDGNARILGYLVVVIVAATVLLLRAALPASLPPIVRAGIVVASSTMLFSLHGLHNFVRSMSGAAWLTANLLVVAALLLAMRRRWWWAWGLALLACTSYGTAFPVWVAFAVIAIVRREPLWRRLVPVGLGLIVVVTWLLLRPGVDAGKSPADDLGTLLYAFLAVIGHLWTADNSGVAVTAGVLILAGYGALLTSRTARSPRLLFWWALAVHAILASAMIAAARIDFGFANGLSSRYTSLSVLATLPLIVLTVATIRQAAPRVTVVVVAVGLLGYTLGVPTATAIRTQFRDATLQAVALRAGVADAYPADLPQPKVLTERLRVLGHYPFSAAFTLGCGGPELGSTLDLSTAAQALPPDSAKQKQPAGWVDAVEPHASAVIVRGWAGGVDPVRCSVVVDGSGKITGGGSSRMPRPDVTVVAGWIPPDSGFQVIAPAAGADRVVFVLNSGRMMWLPAKPGS